MNDEEPRRPGGAARLGLLLSAVVGFFAVFSVGFPPAARDRLPILVLSVALALVAAWNPERGLLAFSFLFPLTGLGDRAFGGADAVAWPVLLFAGFAAGWTFRFLYDFENLPDPSRADRALRALTAVWVIAALLGILRARTLWAFVQGLALRAVNVEGLLDSAAIRDGVLALAALVAGVGYFFVLRRAGPALRSRAAFLALAGCGVSGAAAAAERIGLAPAETNAYWKAAGRISGGAIDPNALGMLCALCLPVAVALLVRGGSPRRRLGAALLGAASAGGLALSGSRSGVAAALIGLLALLFARGLPARRRLVVAALALIAILAAAAVLTRAGRGSAGARLAQVLDPSLPVEYRVSSRPILWASAVTLFERLPATGGGLGAFSWELPSLLAERGRALPLRDNPGNAYLQALAETGAVGFLLTLALAAVLAREAWAALAAPGESPLGAGAGAAILGLLAALLTGSHWLAPDVSLMFFLLAALVCRSPSGEAARWPRRLRGLLIAVYAVAALFVLAGTLSPDEAFRYRPGMGFHARETGRDGTFYWTRKRFALRIGPGRSVRMGLAHFTPEGQPVDLIAESEGREVFRRTLAPGQGLDLRVSGGTSRARVVRFEISRAFIPRRLGISSDRRELGLVAVFPPER